MLTTVDGATRSVHTTRWPKTRETPHQPKTNRKTRQDTTKSITRTHGTVASIPCTDPVAVQPKTRTPNRHTRMPGAIGHGENGKTHSYATNGQDIRCRPGRVGNTGAAPLMEASHAQRSHPEPCTTAPTHRDTVNTGTIGQHVALAARVNVCHGSTRQRGTVTPHPAWSSGGNRTARGAGRSLPQLGDGKTVSQTTGQRGKRDRQGKKNITTAESTVTSKTQKLAKSSQVHHGTTSNAK